MKGIRLMLVVSLAAVALLGLTRMTFAFHDGGVAECAGCHTMHNSDNNAPVRTGDTQFLLKYTTPSDVCISCHSNQFSTDGSKFRSGGDFYWVSLNTTVQVPGHSAGTFSNVTLNGDKRGHNIISNYSGKIIAKDKDLNVGPGGQYPSNNLGCQSCHDPHGKGGHPVLLWGAGATAKTNNSYNFQNGAPVLVNAGRSTSVTDSNHSAYGSGMSKWCSNCHGDMYNQGGMTKHRVDVGLSGGTLGNYNAYLLNGAAAGTVNDTISYVELVPFETGATDVSTLSKTSTAGPTGLAKVMCLSCHRSHASPFEAAGRWDFGATLLEESVPGPIIVGTTALDNALKTNSMYGRAAWNATQRSLCNKCHMKDLP